jgi:hypothetical protein
VAEVAPPRSYTDVMRLLRDHKRASDPLRYGRPSKMRVGIAVWTQLKAEPGSFSWITPSLREPNRVFYAGLEVFQHADQNHFSFE